jgi:transposase-like protein
MGYFKGKQFERDIILVAVGYYCRFSLSYRDVSELLRERGVSVHPTTIMRWVHEYGNIIYQIWKKKNKSAHSVWHLDETYISKSRESGVIFIVRLIRKVTHWIFNFAKSEIIKQPICL